MTTSKVQSPTGSAASITSSDEISELHEVLVRKRASAESFSFEAKLRNARHTEKTSKNGNSYDAVTVDALFLSSRSPKWVEKSKPLFTEEGKLIVDSGPYDEQAVYRITAEKNENGFNSWVKIVRVGK
jgi:hypothetical protein